MASDERDTMAARPHIHNNNTAADDYRSITGVLESEEPASSSSSTPTLRASTPSLPTMPQVQPRRQPSPAAAAPDTSPVPPRQRTLPSPLSSRDASPAAPRPHRTAAPPGTAIRSRSGLRSRHGSTDNSPNRASTMAAGRDKAPSAAAIHRALSSTSVPHLSPTASTDSVTKAPRSSSSSRPAPMSFSTDTTPRWPISPRLKSPEPTGDAHARSHRNTSRIPAKKPEPASTPAIVVQSSSPASNARIAALRDEAVASDAEEPPLTLKAPSRGASGAVPKLETVQESSLPATPGFEELEEESFPSTAVLHKGSDEERNDVRSPKAAEDTNTKPANAGTDTSTAASSTAGSGSDSGSRTVRRGKMQEQRASSAFRPHVISAKPSLSSLSTRSHRDPPLRNVTVETETVTSIPQAPIGSQDRSAASRADGSVRLKPSNETIRPKKEKKPQVKRKAPSINAGTASSKADVFEQKVASAVDEADSSDSDATFIYESNPPECQPPRTRHHSRTPSMTSIASLADPRQLAIRDAHKNPGKKSSMKFGNAFQNGDPDALERGEGTMRIGSGRIGQGSHHHHIGRHGQGRGALSHVVMDSDSSMAQSSRARGPSSRHPSQPNSPRFHTFSVANGQSNGTKKHGEYSVFDLDAEHAADDERTPLIPSGRSPRSRTPRRRNSVTIRTMEQRHRHRHDGGWCRKFAGCLVLSILVLVVIFSSVGLVFATTKPLISVKIQELQNVVASQEEIMLDLNVSAINPNIIGVTVSDMDVSIFAKSKHVGSDTWWRLHGNGPQDNMEDWHPIEYPVLDEDTHVNGIDEGTDPIDDPEVGEPRTMLLGRINHFDTPLNFESSFWERIPFESIGQIRMAKPGNKTEAGGTQRWEEVLQYPFELIVRGNFKYQLPLSTQLQVVSVTASYFYDPDLEKKKLPNKKKVFSINGATNTQLWSQAHSANPTTLGRYDRRALRHLKSR